MIDIQALADQCGIAREYLDVTGKTVVISDSARKECIVPVRLTHLKRRTGS